MLHLQPDTVRILDLDGSVVEKQPNLMQRLGLARTQIVPVRTLGPRVRYLAGRAAMRELEQKLAPAQRNCLTLLGSGDFHHVTAALLRQFPVSEPLSLVVFDRHPDWDRRSPWHCCGSWVVEALQMPQIQKIVFLGLGREDIQGGRINVGPVNELRAGGRVALYPFDAPPSWTPLVFEGEPFPGDPFPGFSAPDLPRTPPGTSAIAWRNLAPLFSQATPEPAAEAAWEAAIRQIIDSLPTRQIYISVDKDCLIPEDAITNWEPGHLPLHRVLSALRLLSAERDVVGVDITGEYSVPLITSPLFRFLARSDRPTSAPGHPGSLVSEPDAAALRRNEETNGALLDVFGF